MRLLPRLLVITLIATGLAVASPVAASGIPETLAAAAPVTGVAVDPAFPVDYVGVIWDGDHVEGGRIRFRHGDRWSGWQPLGEDGVEADGQYASALVRAGDADAYQVIVPPTAGRPRAVAINTTDGRRTRRTPAAGAATSVITRAEWGADETLMTWAPDFYPVQKLTVHHTATDNNDPDPAATVRAIYRYHAVDRGFGDIGYQFLIDEGGRVYEGRYSGGDGDPGHDPLAEGVTGAHVGGWNSGNLGLALLGTLTDVGPMRTAARATEEFLAQLATRHGIDPDAAGEYVNPVNGAVWSGPNIPGHRDFAATECPGGVLYSMLPQVRSDAALLAGDPAAGDTIAPAISGLGVSMVKPSSATISWTTAEPATSQVEYRRTSSSTWTATPVDERLRTSRSVALTGLARRTKYAYRVRSADTAGNITISPEGTFTTK